MATIVPVDRIGDFVGFVSEPTDWLCIDQDRIDAFADATLDHQFIHVDEEASRHGPFGSTIAHGFLSLSLISHFASQFSISIEGVTLGINYGLDKVRFLNPVRVGSNIRAIAKILEIRERQKGRYLMKFEVTIEIEGQEQPALVADWLVMQIVA
nr:MaoC family dehydratase [Microbulbifer sp. NKW57]